MTENNSRLEQHIQTYMQQKAERDTAEEKMEFAKENILKYMNESGDSVIRVPFDETHDIKASVSTNNVQKLDKEAMAELLDVSESTIKKDFLLKSVDDRKLTFAQYKDNHFTEHGERVSIRFVKAEGN